MARVDVLSSLAALAADRRYCRPTITADRTLSITDGRHPVLEQQLGPEFVANDVSFAEADSLQLITGPNMAGKSTFIRQVALIVLMAQVGSYVPGQEPPPSAWPTACSPASGPATSCTAGRARSWSR